MDGNDDPAYGHHSCSSTYEESLSWFVVDLQRMEEVVGVAFTNRDGAGKFTDLLSSIFFKLCLTSFRGHQSILEYFCLFP